MTLLFGIWVILMFLGLFILLFPAYYVFLLNPKWNRNAHNLTRFWGRLLFLSCGVRVNRHWEFTFDPNSTYIFCPNHFSYADIPLMASSTPGFFKFVGKRSLEKIPFFGHMYKKLYILVDRKSMMDSYKALTTCLEALDQDINLVIFPEGGIYTEDPPKLTRFKDGPFRMAIEKGIPIVPVSIPFNWIFLLNKKIDLGGLPLKITYHSPIETSGLKMENLKELKEKTKMVIQEALDKDNQNNDR